jgi:hypothetical protein
MKPAHIVKVTKPFIDAFLNATGVKAIKAVCESTQADNNLWYQEHYYVYMIDDDLSNSIKAPKLIWTDLTGKLITAPKLNVKVPFTDNYCRHVRKFTNYGSITVFSGDSQDVPQTMYMPNNEIKVLKALMKMSQSQNP